MPDPSEPEPETSINHLREFEGTLINYINHLKAPGSPLKVDGRLLEVGRTQLQHGINSIVEALSETPSNLSTN